jgi:hypothetical protein
MFSRNIMKFSTLILLVFLISLSPILFSHYSAVFAQGTTIVSVQPSAGDVIINNLSIINLNVTNGVNVNAFDVIITYDSSILTLSSWSYGSYLSSLGIILQTDTPGYFRLVATQLGKPGVYGDGNLLNLVFRGKVNGSSPIMITKCDFANPEGSVYSPERISSSLLVHSDPALINKFLVTGTLTLQSVLDKGGIPLAFDHGATNWLGPYSAISINQPTSNINLTDVYEDSYLITTAMPRYLNVTVELNKIIGINSGKTNISALQLKGGNAVWQREVEGVWTLDSVIDAGDISLIGAFYGQTGTNLDADVNFDGIVNIRDLALVAGNYGLNSSTAYAAWVP